MATLAEQLRAEIMQQCKESTRSFSDRRELVIREIRGGKREVMFRVAESYDKDYKSPTRAMLNALGVPADYRLAYTPNDRGVFYRNGKHYTTVECRAKTYPHTVTDTKEYCVEDVEGWWRPDELYNEEELRDLGDYFVSEGFRVSINLHSDYHARYSHRASFYNTANLIVSL